MFHSFFLPISVTTTLDSAMRTILKKINVSFIVLFCFNKYSFGFSQWNFLEFFSFVVSLNLGKYNFRPCQGDNLKKKNFIFVLFCFSRYSLVFSLRNYFEKMIVSFISLFLQVNNLQSINIFQIHLRYKNENDNDIIIIEHWLKQKVLSKQKI